MDAPRVLSPSEARSLFEAGAILLDVRDDHEWESGRAPGATHIALMELADRVGELDRARTVVCVCRSGGRSLRATMFLDELGHDAANLEGGMIAWVEDGGPIVGDGDEPEIV